MSGACFLLDFDDDDDLSTEYLGAISGVSRLLENELPGFGRIDILFDSLSGLVFADEDEDEEE